MKTESTGSEESCLAVCVAPEDLNCGDYVAALNVVHEFPSFLWCCDGSGAQLHEPVRMQFRAPQAGIPLKLKAICLPFIFVTHPNGKSVTMDVRQTQFVRLNSEYAKTVWKQTKSK